jgi:hypothetical protein
MPAAKRPQRPRIDAIVGHIKKGSYDDDLSVIQTAINERNEIRKNVVRKLVEEVYGEGYDVVPQGAASANPFIRRAQERESAEIQSGVRAPGEVLPGESPHVLDPNSPEGQAALSGAGDEADRLDADPDFESHSPLIGGLPEGA